MIKYILIIAVILFFPVPIFLKLNYIDNKIAFYLFSKKINKERHVVQKVKNKVPFYIRTIDFEFVDNFFQKLKNTRIKPSLYFKIKLNYGFEDACLTGMFYGVFSCLNPLLYYFMQCIFKIKKFEFELYSNFEEPGFKFNMEGIIFINLVKIINITGILANVYFLRKNH